MKPCKRCNGTGRVIKTWGAFNRGRWTVCSNCRGKKEVTFSSKEWGEALRAHLVFLWSDGETVAQIAQHVGRKKSWCWGKIREHISAAQWELARKSGVSWAEHLKSTEWLLRRPD